MKQVEEEFLNTFLIEQKYKSYSKGAALILPCMKQSSSASQERKKKCKAGPWNMNDLIWTKLKLANSGKKCTFAVIHSPSLTSWCLLWTQVWFPVKALPRKETGWFQWWSGSGLCPAVRVAAPQPGSICWLMQHCDCVCQGWLPLALGKVRWKMWHGLLRGYHNKK